MRFPSFVTLVVLGLAALQSAALAQKQQPREYLPPPFDQYLEQRVRELSGKEWQEGITPENWTARQAAMRKDLSRMLGLDPLPPLNSQLTPSVDDRICT